MKNTFLFAPLFFLSFSLFSQVTGAISYHETITRYSKRWGEFKTENDWVLHFNDSLSLCIYQPPKEDGESSSAGGISVRTFKREITDFFLLSFKNGQIRDQRELFRKQFIIAGNLPKDKWTFTGKQGVVLGYPCMEAIYVKDTITTLAWFTPRISVKTGPKQFRSLPGLILYMELDNGRHIITATKIDLENAPDNSIFNVEYTDGAEEVSPEEFEKILKEKTEEIRMMYGR